MFSKPNQDALTEDEIAFLRSSGVPDDIRRFVARQHENVGVRTSAYRKVAAAARAERNALVEIRLLEIARLDETGELERDRRIHQLERENAELQSSHEAMREDLMRAVSMPTAAIHSDGTGR